MLGLGHKLVKGLETRPRGTEEFGMEKSRLTAQSLQWPPSSPGVAGLLYDMFATP